MMLETYLKNSEMSTTEDTKYNENHEDSCVGRTTTISIAKQTKKKPKKVPLGWKQNATSYLREFCDSTTIHGIKYIGEGGRFFVEKLVWTITVTILCYLCVSLILKSYNKWVSSPIIVTFATTETPIWKIPFPAITVCPEVKYDPEKFNHTDVLMRKLARDNVTTEEQQYYESLLLLCSVIGHQLALLFNDDLNLVINETAIEYLVEVQPDVNPLNLSRVRWQQKDYPISDVLSGTFTSEGLCYSFNMLEFDELFVGSENYVVNRSIKDTKPLRWTLEGGYPDDSKLDTFPRRTFKTGTSGGLHLSLVTNHSHLDYLCRESLQGFKVTLHHPSELPNMDQHFRLPLDQAVIVGIKPRMILMSEELKAYDVSVRKCYYGLEKPLKYFKHYTQKNCLFECLSNYTLQQCDCLAYYMPKYDESPICGPGSQDCLEQSKVQYLMQENNSEAAENSGLPCDCLPSCTSLEYDVEVSQTDWNWRESLAGLTALGFEDWGFDFESLHISRLEVYYREMQFLTSERHELYGYVDFFSSTGGLLGLFIGFSVTSGFEIVYFLTLRLVCNVKKFGRGFWSGQQKFTET